MTDRNAGRAPGKHLTTTFGYDEVEVRGRCRSASGQSGRSPPITFALDRQTAEGFYDALVSRDPVRIDPFLDDDVDRLIVGPIELFAFYGQHYGRRASLMPIGSCHGSRKRAPAPVGFCRSTAMARPRLGRLNKLSGARSM